MSKIVKSIDVDVPVATTFEELTRFERLPRFMPGVIAVQWLDDRHLYWRAHILGLEIMWVLEIAAITAGRQIAWFSRQGPRVDGTIALEPLAPDGTRVTVVLHHNPSSFVQEMSDYLGLLGHWVERSLVRFRDMMERTYATLDRLPPADELVGQ